MCVKLFGNNLYVLILYKNFTLQAIQDKKISNVFILLRPYYKRMKTDDILCSIENIFVYLFYNHFIK